MNILGGSDESDSRHIVEGFHLSREFHGVAVNYGQHSDRLWPRADLIG